MVGLDLLLSSPSLFIWWIYTLQNPQGWLLTQNKTEWQRTKSVKWYNRTATKSHRACKVWQDYINNQATLGWQAALWGNLFTSMGSLVQAEDKNDSRFLYLNRRGMIKVSLLPGKTTWTICLTGRTVSGYLYPLLYFTAKWEIQCYFVAFLDFCSYVEQHTSWLVNRSDWFMKCTLWCVIIG